MWRLVSLDVSTMDVADERVNEKAFGRRIASRGQSAFPQLRFVSPVENGTHVLFGTQMGDNGTGELALAKGTFGHLKARVLCLADGCFFGIDLWDQAKRSGGDLLWRVNTNEGRSRRPLTRWRRI